MEVGTFNKMYIKSEVGFCWLTSLEPGVERADRTKEMMGVN